MKHGAVLLHFGNTKPPHLIFITSIRAKPRGKAEECTTGGRPYSAAVEDRMTPYSYLGRMPELTRPGTSQPARWPSPDIPNAQSSRRDRARLSQILRYRKCAKGGDGAVGYFGRRHDGNRCLAAETKALKSWSVFRNPVLRELC